MVDAAVEENTYRYRKKEEKRHRKRGEKTTTHIIVTVTRICYYQVDVNDTKQGKLTEINQLSWTSPADNRSDDRRGEGRGDDRRDNRLFLRNLDLIFRHWTVSNITSDTTRRSTPVIFEEAEVRPSRFVNCPLRGRSEASKWLVSTVTSNVFLERSQGVSQQNSRGVGDFILFRVRHKLC
jgi:hypothetical protein